MHGTLFMHSLMRPYLGWMIYIYICIFLTFELGREVLDIAAQAIEVGVTTEEIDKLVHEVSK